MNNYQLARESSISKAYHARDSFKKPLQVSYSERIFNQSTLAFPQDLKKFKFYKKFERTKSILKDLDYVSELPLITLKKLFNKDIIPLFINKSQEEDSIIFEFWRKDYYYMVEFFLDGDIVFLKKNDKTEEMAVWDLTEKSLFLTLEHEIYP